MSGPKQTGRQQRWLVGHTKEAVGGRGAQCPEKKLTKRVCSTETGTGRDGCPFSSVTAHLLAAHTEIQRSVRDRQGAGGRGGGRDGVGRKAGHSPLFGLSKSNWIWGLMAHEGL